MAVPAALHRRAMDDYQTKRTNLLDVLNAFPVPEGAHDYESSDVRTALAQWARDGAEAAHALGHLASEQMFAGVNATLAAAGSLNSIVVGKMRAHAYAVSRAVPDTEAEIERNNEVTRSLNQHVENVRGG